MNEFEFIKNIKKSHSLSLVGDDCAVLPKDDATDQLVTADLLVEGIDFRLDWTSAASLGHKTLAVSLSDIAAMGGEPKWALLSIAVPETIWNSKFLDNLYAGWHELASQFGVELVGGDISRSPSKLVIDSIVGGEIKKGSAIRRSGAQVGDSIYVSGPIGGAAAGLRLLNEGVRATETGNDERQDLINKQLRPTPQVALGKRLSELGLATSMIDLSDGLSSDLAHLCRMGTVGARIIAEEIPFESELMTITGSIDVTLEIALNGGEDFELLFTADRAKVDSSGIQDIFRIGEITENVGAVELVRNGIAELLPPGGFRHF